MKIIIETIPHPAQRYDTAGDWYRDPDGTLHIKVSEMTDPAYCHLVAIHELIEAVLCEQRGITEAQVDKFDFAWQRTDPLIEEPGDDPQSPYYWEHQEASIVERLMAQFMCKSWYLYILAIDKLPKWSQYPTPEETHKH